MACGKDGLQLVGNIARRLPTLATCFVSMIVISILAGTNAASGSDAIELIEHAALAPFSAFLHKDANDLCRDFVPVVASRLVEARKVDEPCVQAAGEAFTVYEAPRLLPEPTLISLKVKWRTDRATVRLSFRSQGSAQITLRRVAGSWRVSSPSEIIVVPCPSARAELCVPGREILALAIGAPKIHSVDISKPRSGTSAR